MKIAVLVYDLTIEYNVVVLNGIVSFFEDKKDVQLIISPVYLPKYDMSFSEYQYWSSVDILKSKEIDAYIIVPNSFGSYISFEELSKKLKDYTDRPVVTVGTPLNFPKKYYTTNSCVKAYDNIVEHLINKHNCKKIGFFTAGLVDSIESEERFNAYKKALKKYGLEYNPEYTFAGDFTPGTSKEVLLKKFKNKKEINFDAIICANDYMAAGCMLAFMELGVKCPQDVILVGFDNMQISILTTPTITTIDQHVKLSGTKAAQMAYKLVKGNKVPEKTVIDAFPIYRASCGCVPTSANPSSYYDQDGKFYETNPEDQIRNFEIYTNVNESYNSINQLLNNGDVNTSNGNIQKSLFPSLTAAHVSIMAVCFYKEMMEISEDFPFILPDTVSLLSFYDEKTKVIQQYIQDGEQDFNPHEHLLPDSVSYLGEGTFFLLPIFLQNKNYGYMICKFHDKNYTLISIYSKLLTNLIIQVYESSKNKKQRERLVERNQNLSFQSKTDELTQIFNRRGFLEYGQRLIDLSVATEKNGVVFFCDMDGLKKINDTYGHKIGDLAIKTEAQIIKKAFRDSDLVGRLSGDEFGIVAPGFKVKNLQVLKDRISLISNDLSNQAGLPFILSLSVGAIEFYQEKDDLQTLLIEADKNLYKEKQIKHAQK